MKAKIAGFFSLLVLLTSCQAGLKVNASRSGSFECKDGTSAASAEDCKAPAEAAVAFKLETEECIDPDLSLVASTTKLMLCDGTIASGTYEVPDLSQLKAENLKSGVTVAGIAGTLNINGTPCASDGAVDCVANASYPAAASTGAAGKIVAGQTLAGIAGTYSPDFPDAANVRASDTVNGSAGTLADCAADGSVGCVTTSSFKSVQISGLAAKIKNGVSVAGETGTYPSVGNLLTGADGTADLDSATFQAKIKSSAAFEYFDAAGNRYIDTGDADIDAANIVSGVTIFGTAGSASNPSPDPWDVRHGVTVGSTTGKLKINCRNMVGHYDGAGGYTGGSSILHTIDDYNYDGSVSGDYPTTNPWASDEHLCGFSSIAAAERTWERVTTSPVTSGENSVFKDKISGLNWSRGTVTTAKDWDEAAGGAGNGAIEYCTGLDAENAGAGHGSTTGWRLPTQKELMAAYEHGIHDLDSEHTATDHLGDLDTWFWSSSTRSNITTSAWYVNLSSGRTYGTFKTGSGSVLCVAP